MMETVDTATVLVDVDELAQMIADLPEPDADGYDKLTLGHVSISVGRPPRGHTNTRRHYEIVCRGIAIAQYYRGTARQAAEIVNVSAAAADVIQSGLSIIGVRQLIQRVGYEEALRRMREPHAWLTLMRERRKDY